MIKKHLSTKFIEIFQKNIFLIITQFYISIILFSALSLRTLSLLDIIIAWTK